MPDTSLFSRWASIIMIPADTKPKKIWGQTTNKCSFDCYKNIFKFSFSQTNTISELQDASRLQSLWQPFSWAQNHKRFLFGFVQNTICYETDQNQPCERELDFRWKSQKHDEAQKRLQKVLWRRSELVFSHSWAELLIFVATHLFQRSTFR